MIRTQVYLPDDLFRELQELAQKEGKNQSQLIRDGIAAVLYNYQLKKKRRDWSQFIGASKSHQKTDAVKDIQDYYENGVV